MHCIAHRLALASEGAADSIVYLVKFQEIVNSLYKLFEKSPGMLNKLDAMQEVLNQKQKLKLKQIFHTRWLSFDGALKALITNYSALLSVLHAEKSAKSAGLLKSMATYKFLYCAHFLSDVMNKLSRLSKAFQAEDVNFASVCSLLESTVQNVRSLCNGSGRNLSAFLKSIPETPVESALIPGQYEFEYDGHILKDSYKQRQEAESICRQFIESILINLESRFDKSGDSAILSAIQNLFTPSTIAKVTDPDSYHAMTNDAKLVSQFFLPVNNASIQDEFTDFANDLQNNVNKFKLLKNVYDVMQYAISIKELYPNVADIAMRFLATPVSTVSCERGFSRHNAIKTKKRNCLSTATVECLMHISMQKPDNQFDYTSAFRKWVDVKKRRIL